MPQIFEIMVSIIAPIILVAGTGVLLEKTSTLDARSLSRVIIYVTSPALVFYGMANTTIKSDELLDLFLFALSSATTITILAWLISYWSGMERITASAFVLSIGLMNIGNYGIPFNEFAFGRPGLERALVITVVQALYAHTVGVFIASWGRASLAQAAKNAVQVPTPYAALLGLAVNFDYVQLPALLMRVAEILEGAAIPLMLVLLGVQIARVSFAGDQRWGIILGASGLRLVGGAAVGFGLATVLGLQGVTQQVAIAEAAMPTAVLTTILATEFKSDAKLVSSIVLVSTLLSVISLSVLLLILRL